MLWSASASTSSLSDRFSLRRSPSSVSRTSFLHRVHLTDARFARMGPCDPVPHRRHYYRAFRLLADLCFASFPSLSCTAFAAATSSPRSPGIPRARALLYDLGRAGHGPRCCLPLFLTASASTLFTRLNHTAHALAVYASPWGRPCGARLASGCAFLAFDRVRLVTHGDTHRSFSS
jgi:hypothetical protein